MLLDLKLSVISFEIHKFQIISAIPNIKITKKYDSKNLRFTNKTINQNKINNKIKLNEYGKFK